MRKEKYPKQFIPDLDTDEVILKTDRDGKGTYFVRKPNSMIMNEANQAVVSNVLRRLRGEVPKPLEDNNTNT